MNVYSKYNRQNIISLAPSDYLEKYIKVNINYLMAEKNTIIINDFGCFNLELSLTICRDYRKVNVGDNMDLCATVAVLHHKC